MIIRVFRGLVHAGMQEPYVRFLHDEAFPDLRSRPGLISLQASTPAEEDHRQFLVTSVWADLHHLISFAGERWREAKIMPGETGFLREKHVHHYQSLHYETLVPEEAMRAVVKPPASVVDAGILQVDLARKVVILEGETLELPPLEFALLTELALRAGEPVHPAELVARVWPTSAYVTADDLRRVVYRLRRRLARRHRVPPLIRHRRGFGYLLDTSPSAGEDTDATPARR
jgi:DNA-binding winged helix-turn-helix (wHTH) protein/heme-degrading monooxygenase HmoA